MYEPKKGASSPFFHSAIQYQIISVTSILTVTRYIKRLKIC